MLLIGLSYLTETYNHLCVCVDVCRWPCVWINIFACICMWSQDFISQELYTLYLETESLLYPELASRFICILISRDLPFSASPTLGWQCLSPQSVFAEWTLGIKLRPSPHAVKPSHLLAAIFPAYPLAF